MASINQLIERRNRILGKAYSLFYEQPLHIVEGSGVWLTDVNGDKYLDVYNNVPHVGHCHPRVAEAICRQVKTLNTHTRYLHQNVLDYAERLTAYLPGGLDIAMFACTGTEANELALRLARAVSGGSGMIVTPFAYHGNSWAISQISTSDVPPEMREDNVVTVPAPDTYRGAYRSADAGERYAAHVAKAIETLRERGHLPAAFIVDIIFSSEGVPDIPADYLQKAIDIVHDAGGVFVADEVQPGFGRTGSNFWGFQNHGIQPDIVTMGKPMGNGHPISAVVTSASIVNQFCESADYFNTFGGNPVSCAAASAVLDVIEEEGLQANALSVGEQLREGLAEMAKRHEIIGDIRGSGLFIGIELVNNHESLEPAAAEARWIVNDMKDRGVLIGSTGPDRNVLKIRPPLVFDSTNADTLLERMDASMEALRQQD